MRLALDRLFDLCDSAKTGNEFAAQTRFQSSQSREAHEFLTFLEDVTRTITSTNEQREKKNKPDVLWIVLIFNLITKKLN